MKILLLLVSLVLAAPTFAAVTSSSATPDPSSEATLDFDSEFASPDSAAAPSHYLCAIDCARGSCARWCSTQQRCQATCTPQGQAACYCYL